MIKATYIDHMGSCLSVVNAARVSFGKSSDWIYNQNDAGVDLTDPKLCAGDVKLINYLASHGHISPFGHCFASFHIKAPIFVARQLVKHKFLRWNEISRRYVDDEPEFYVPDVWRGRSADKKQGSEGIAEEYYRQEGSVPTEDLCLERYKRMLNLGVAPEQARMVLPQNTMTEWYWSGSLDAFASMCNLRCKPDTQLETRIIADEISGVMANLYPVSWGALTKDVT